MTSTPSQQSKSSKSLTGFICPSCRTLNRNFDELCQREGVK